MEILIVKNVNYQGKLPNSDIPESLFDFSYDFEFGRSYLLNAPLGNGAWALSWIISGTLSQRQGTISMDSNVLDLASRKKISWRVRYDEIKRFGMFRQSIKSQIEQGLKSNKGGLLRSHQEIIEKFGLTPARYSRKLSQLSNEGWSASCAIGFANGREIFCFPHLDYIGTTLIRDYRYLWFEDLINLLKSMGALVILPAELSEAANGLCDEVLYLKRD